MTSNREILSWVFENIGRPKVAESDAPSRGAYDFLVAIKSSNKLTEQFYWKWMEGAWREDDTAASTQANEAQHVALDTEIERLLESFTREPVLETERTQAA